MGDLNQLRWPLNKMSFPDTPFITSHEKSLLSGSLIGRTWFSSNGVSVSVPLNVSLFVSINSARNPGQLCLASKSQEPYYSSKTIYPTLEYTVCVAQNLSTLQNYVISKQTTKLAKNTSSDTQDDGNNQALTDPKLAHEHENENILLERIIWSTNVNVLPNFNHQTLQSYVNKITNYGLAGIILLDSRWENSIGELKMNEGVFNNSKVLINVLHNKGFKIMLTVSPNIAVKSNMTGSASKYVMLDHTLNVPLLTRCSTNLSQICSLINLTDTSNKDHFRQTLIKELLNQQSGLSVDGLYFKGVESSLIPSSRSIQRNNPDKFVDSMNGMIKNLDIATGLSVSVNSGTSPASYVTIFDRESTWQALQSIIPSVLTLGLLGYPLVNSNTVGGIDLFTKLKNETDYINKELYLRWFQLAIFLPVVQFAEPPGGNDLDVVKVAKRLIKLRNEQLLPEMKQSLNEFYSRGSPIIRPMWWKHNHDNDAYSIDDQFFVGDNIIVAPIVHEGKTERDIFLPDGWWKDEMMAVVIRGGKWMRKYQVPLDKVAFFVRTGSSNI